MIHESSPITNTFISVPPDLGQLDCGAYLAGIIAGILDSTKFVSHLFIWISPYILVTDDDIVHT